MNRSKLSIIVAMDEKRGIGKDGKIPWHISQDLKRFRHLTSGHPVIMGRKTFESIGRPLPNRINIVITRKKAAAGNGVEIVHSFEEALREGIKYQVLSSKYNEEDKKLHDTKYKIHNTEHEVFIIGGGQIYAQALPIADKLYLTIVQGNYNADTFFPDYSAFTKVIKKEDRESEGYRYTFLQLEKEG